MPQRRRDLCLRLRTPRPHCSLYQLAEPLPQRLQSQHAPSVSASEHRGLSVVCPPQHIQWTAGFLAALSWSTIWHPCLVSPTPSPGILASVLSLELFRNALPDTEVLPQHPIIVVVYRQRRGISCASQRLQRTCHARSGPSWDLRLVCSACFSLFYLLLLLNILILRVWAQSWGFWSTESTRMGWWLAQTPWDLLGQSLYSALGSSHPGSLPGLFLQEGLPWEGDGAATCRGPRFQTMFPEKWDLGCEKWETLITFAV